MAREGSNDLYRAWKNLLRNSAAAAPPITTQIGPLRCGGTRPRAHTASPLDLVNHPRSCTGSNGLRFGVRAVEFTAKHS